MTCGFTLDPTKAQSVLDACFAIIAQPDSPANLARGVFVLAVLLLVVIGLIAFAKSA